MKRVAAFLLSMLLMPCALAADEPALLGRLRGEFQPGLAVARAQEILRAHGANFSVKSLADCEALVRQSRLPTQISPRGGPCVFGKIPVSHRWYGAKTDVILQLVFGADGKLVDANFEEIESFL